HFVNSRCHARIATFICWIVNNHPAVCIHFLAILLVQLVCSICCSTSSSQCSKLFHQAVFIRCSFIVRRVSFCIRTRTATFAFGTRCAFGRVTTTTSGHFYARSIHHPRHL